MEQAIKIQEAKFGSRHPALAETLSEHAVLLRKTGDPVSAAAVEARADSMGAKNRGDPGVSQELTGPAKNDPESALSGDKWIEGTLLPTPPEGLICAFSSPVTTATSGRF